MGRKVEEERKKPVRRSYELVVRKEVKILKAISCLRNEGSHKKNRRHGEVPPDQIQRAAGRGHHRHSCSNRRSEAWKASGIQKQQYDEWIERVFLVARQGK